MGRIDLALLRKRAEHNDGVLADLREITLHGQHLEKIEIVGHVCRELRILYLQNNVIGEISDLHHLKELQYLNLAINNIVAVQNLEGCESLSKLDLTMNFIPLANLPTVRSLASLHSLQELHLLGNPCTQWCQYRLYVLAWLPQLRALDGTEVSDEERTKAIQLRDHVEAALQEHLSSEAYALPAAYEEVEARDLPRDAEGNEHLRRPWCPETRLQEHREQERLNKVAEQTRTASQNRLLNGPALRYQFREELPPLPQEGEPLMQKNEGKWEFTLHDSSDGSVMILDVALGKGCCTEDVSTDVQPNCVRLLAKGKLLQLTLPEEGSPSKSRVRRSKTTGNLVIDIPKRVWRVRAKSNSGSLAAASQSHELCTISECWRDTDELPAIQVQHQ